MAKIPTHLLLAVIAFSISVEAFLFQLPTSPRLEVQVSHHKQRRAALDASDNVESLEPKNSFLSLGDDLIDGFQSNVNQLTGKSTYEFGDLSRYVDRQAKNRLAMINKKTKEGLFELDKAAKEKVCQFTKKSSYQIGDISRELIRRFQEGDYATEDVWLFLKIVAIIGLNIKPIAALLPVKVLTDLLEASTAQVLGEKVVGTLVPTLTNEIELRLQEWALLGEKEKLGSALSSSINVKGLSETSQRVIAGDLVRKVATGFTGKEDYNLGDIIGKVFGRTRDDEATSTGHSPELEPPNSSTKASSARVPVEHGAPSTQSGPDRGMAENFMATPELVQQARPVLDEGPSEPVAARRNIASAIESLDTEALASFQKWDAQLLRTRRTTASPEATAWTSLLDRDFEEWDQKFLEVSAEINNDAK